MPRQSDRLSRGTKTLNRASARKPRDATMCCFQQFQHNDCDDKCGYSLDVEAMYKLRNQLFDELVGSSFVRLEWPLSGASKVKPAPGADPRGYSSRNASLSLIMEPQATSVYHSEFGSFQPNSLYSNEFGWDRPNSTSKLSKSTRFNQQPVHHLQLPEPPRSSS